MFDGIKIKRARREFQLKYNLTDEEMKYVAFSKSPFGREYFGYLDTKTYMPQLYRKTSNLNNILAEKLEKAKNTFFELAVKYGQEEIFNRDKRDCYIELEDFLYRFQYNSSKVRISFVADATAEERRAVWDKADVFLNAICLTYLLSLDDELVGFSNIDRFSMVKSILSREDKLSDKNYEEIRSLVIEKLKLAARVVDTLRDDWLKASTLSMLR